MGVRVGASRLTSPAHEVDHEIDRRGSSSPAQGSAGAVCSGAGDRGRQQTVGVTARRCAAAKACRCMGDGRGRRDRGRGRGSRATCTYAAARAGIGRESATRRACTRHVEQVRFHGNGPTELEGKAAPLARRRLGEQRTPLQRQLTEEYGRARLHGARASCRGALSHPTEYINASGWLTAPRLEVLHTRPVIGAGLGIRQLKLGLVSAQPAPGKSF